MKATLMRPCLILMMITLVTAFPGCQGPSTTPAAELATQVAPPEPAAPPTPMDLAAITTELMAMGEADQAIRGELVQWMRAHPGEQPPSDIAMKMTRSDREHAARVKEIIDEIGWPTYSKVGKDASGNAWLIIQHAVFDQPLMQRALELMTPLLGTGEINDQDYALLFDRVNMMQGKAQRFGTQGATLIIDGIKHHGLHPIEDAEHVDERRAALGLPPVADYRQLLRTTYGIPDEEPDFPIDITLEEFNAIKRAARANRDTLRP